MNTSIVEITDTRWKRLNQIGGIAAIVAAALWLVGLVNLIVTSPMPGVAYGWLGPFRDNWLIVLFKLNAGFDDVGFDRLHGLRPVDLLIMALVATMHVGLYAALRRTSRIGSLVAVIQPFLGIVLLLATQMAGRSTVMGAGLVISLVMLRSNVYGKVSAWTGILASVLLLIGDVSTTPGSRSDLVAVLIGIGYVLLMTWFLMVGRRLLLMECIAQSDACSKSAV